MGACGDEEKIIMSTALESSIFRLLAYMAYTSFPLTTQEIWRWCDDEGATYSAVHETLEASVWLREHGMKSAEGFWGIGPVETWRRERIDRVTDALRKSRRAARFARFASKLPWVRMIAICNSLAFSYTNEKSDIDLFVVTKRKRLWSTRLILTGALALLHLRPRESSRDPICLSFFVDEDHLDFASMKIGADDPYLLFWTASLVSILDRDDVMTKIHAVNRWIRPSLPRDPRVHRALAYRAEPGWTVPDVGILESFAERMQRARFPVALRELMNQDTRVVVTDGVLKFHENDRREAIRDAWQMKCKEAGV